MIDNMWILPLNQAHVNRYAPSPKNRLLPLKEAAFRRHLAQTLPAERWTTLAHMPTSYLRDIHPAIYHYGPQAPRTTLLGQTFIRAYNADPAGIFKAMPHYDHNHLAGEEIDYLEALLGTDFRPGYLLHGYWDSLLSELDHAIKDTRTGVGVGELLADMMSVQLAHDLIPHTDAWQELVSHHDRFLSDTLNLPQGGKNHSQGIAF